MISAMNRYLRTTLLAVLLASSAAVRAEEPFVAAAHERGIAIVSFESGLPPAPTIV